ncbi:hypothetical protein BXZ70DRAFT_908210 [Cristinia sonorae]|uniref:Uncharacterized protein n=1 Tax=Cristinia sonorae TaxID=1940300 RepID=A0A8K0XNE5_9AGAR|nr:hypothetical protein BXZ70DRAFT_908210 [Cristinia sonorae]
MSTFTNGMNVPSVTLWSDNLPQLSDRRPKNEHMSIGVPHSYDMLLDWCYVAPNPDWKNRFEANMVFLREDEEAAAEEEERVYVSIEGEYSLLVYRIESSCYRAVQSITIESLGELEPFDVQRRGLLSVRRMVSQSLPVGNDDVVDLGEDAITFCRKVFTKDRLIYAKSLRQASAMTEPMRLAHEDLKHESALRRVQGRWMIAHGLLVERMDGNGVVTPTSKMGVKAGRTPPYPFGTPIPICPKSGASEGRCPSPGARKLA